MENGENKDLQGRRDFFKEAAKKALPLFAVALIGSSFLSSCSKVTGCGNSCSGSCDKSCSGDCEGGCSGDCDNSCHDACMYGCYYLYN